MINKEIRELYNEVLKLNGTAVSKYHFNKMSKYASKLYCMGMRAIDIKIGIYFSVDSIIRLQLMAIEKYEKLK